MMSTGPQLTTAPQISIQRTELTGSDPLMESLKALLSIDFAAHDARLNACLASAREEVESLTGLLLSPGAVTVRWGQLYDYEALPYGPVKANTVAITDVNGVALTGYSFAGDFPVLTGTFPAGVQLSYQAGYDLELDGDSPMPSSLAEAVRQCAANAFDNGNRDWKPIARKKARYTWAS